MKDVECRACRGTGVRWSTCHWCQGSGERNLWEPGDCLECLGTGQQLGECVACEGRGTIPRLVGTSLDFLNRGGG